jgi:hypothetical protein
MKYIEKNPNPNFSKLPGSGSKTPTILFVFKSLFSQNPKFEDYKLKNGENIEHRRTDLMNEFN